jgi:hypothetical protein
MKLLAFILLASVWMGCHQGDTPTQRAIDAAKAKGWPDSSIIVLNDTPYIIIPQAETDAPDSSMPIVTSKWVHRASKRRNVIPRKDMTVDSSIHLINDGWINYPQYNLKSHEVHFIKDTASMKSPTSAIGYIVSDTHSQSYLYRKLDSPKTFIIQTGEKILLRMENTNYNKIVITDTMGAIKLLIKTIIETDKRFNN